MEDDELLDKILGSFVIVLQSLRYEHLNFKNFLIF